MRKIISFIVLSALCAIAYGASIPLLTVSMDAVDGAGANGQENVTYYEGSAPVSATFRFQLKNADDWSITYEWRFCHEGGTLDAPYMIRYEPEPQISFSQAGTDSIALYATLTRGTEVLELRREYWTYENQPLWIKTSQSAIVFPNAFSPNGDGKNDFYRPKSYQSIIEFRAIIFNRWGQKIYEWDNVAADGWDGTYNGRDVKQGVYFALIRAKGSDGMVYEFKKDVNLLRTYDEVEPTSGGTDY